MVPPRIMLPLAPGEDDSDQTILELCGMKHEIRVWIETAGGSRLQVTFMTPAAMISHIQASEDAEWRHYTFMPGLIVIERIDMQTMNRAVIDCWERGFFKPQQYSPAPGSLGAA